MVEVGDAGEVSFRAFSHVGRINSLLRGVDASESGKFCFFTPALRSILDGMRLSGSEEVTIWTDDEGVVRVESGSAKFEIGGFPVDSFPPDEEDDSFHEANVASEDFKDAVSRALSAAGKNFPRIELSFSESRLRVTGLSQARMCTSVVDVDSDISTKLYVATHSIEPLVKIMNSSSTGLLNLRWSESSFRISYDDTVAAVRLCQSSFPPHEQVMDNARNGNRFAIVETTKFRSAVKSFSFFRGEKVVVPMVMDFREGEVGVSLHNMQSNKGGGEWAVPCEFSGDPIKVGVNPDLLSKATSGMLGTKMKITMSGEKAPILLSFVGMDSPVYLVMPWDLV
jgi:DNA polymerase III sliding clamp (beta) subunit (PCNA family)